MLRMIGAVAFVLALIALPVAYMGSSTPVEAKAAYKVCKHKTASGKVKTWRCGADQPCCAAEMINYYTCGSKAMGCL